MSWKRENILILIVLLSLSLLVTAASAAEVTVQNAAVPEGGTGTIQIFLDSALQGLSGYNMTVSIGHPDDAEITGVAYPDWASPHRTGVLPADRVFIKSDDVDSEVIAGSTNILLATLTVRGDSVGKTPINVIVEQMDDLNGGIIPTHVTPGMLTVGDYLPPTASFTYEPDHGPAGLTVNFTDTSTHSDELVSWSWSFGDGATSDEPNPEHVYATENHYTVSLTVTDDSGGSDTETVTDAIDVFGPAPVADFSATNTDGASPLSVTFTDLSTSSEEIDTWSWNFGDGGTSDQPNPVHEYTVPGDYDVTLTVTDSEDQTGSVTKPDFVDVWYPAPEASFTLTPDHGVIPLEVQFTDGSTTQDEIDMWNWSFGDGTWFNTTDESESSPVHTYTEVSDYNVMLIVTDSEGLSDSEYLEDAVDAYYPAPVVEFSADPTEGPPELSVQFTDLTTSQNGIEFWNWSFGDGTWFNTTNDYESSPSHTYTTPGDYFVTLWVMDTEDQVAYKESDNAIDVYFPPPDADFEANITTGFEPLTVKFTDKTQSGEELEKWNWSFGDGTYSEEADPVHVYLDSDMYTVTLIVTDSNGFEGTETKTDYINVLDLPPVADFSFSPDEPKVNDVVTFDASASYDPDPDGLGEIADYTWNFGDGSEVQTVSDPVITHAFGNNRVYNVTLTVSNDDDTANSTYHELQIWTEEVDMGTALDGTTLVDQGHGQNQDFTIDTGATSGSVTTGTVDGVTTIYMDNPSDVWSNVTLKTTEFTDEDGVLRGDITEAVITSAPQVTDLSDSVGDVTTQVELDLTKIPDSAIEMSVVEGAPSNVMQNGFQIAALNQHLAVDAVAYTIHFEDTEVFNANLSSTGFGAKLNLSISHDWVMANGGPASIKILRYSDDGLTQEILETQYVGTDSEGMDFFVANSPNGLSYIGAAGTHGNPIQSSFTMEPSEGFAPLTVQFHDASVGVGINQWNWNFGDEATSEEQNPSHTYNNVGSYVIELNVTNTLGNWSTSHETLMVSKPPVYPSFTAVPESGDAPLTVNFTDTSTTYSGTILSRNWSFGDGSYSEAAMVDHLYGMPGTYTVRLEVTNSYDNTSSTTRDIMVTMPVVTAGFTAVPTSGDAPLNVSFTDNSMGAGINSWSWNFGDNGMSTEQNPYHDFQMPGTYRVNLTVGTIFGNVSSAEQDITVTLPAVQAAFTAVPTSGNAPLNVTFTSISTGAGINSWFWDFGDNTNMTGQTVQHIYRVPGNYTANLTVQTVFGNMSHAEQTITVSTPSGAIGTGTEIVPGVTSGSTLIFDFGTTADTTLDIVTSANVSAGSYVTVTDYTTPPVAAMSTAPSGFSLLGKYITIDAPLLEGNVSQVNITMKYDPATIPAGVAETDLVIEYYNRNTNAWEALTGAHGVDTTRHIVWAISTHLSDYGIMAPTPAAPPSGGSGGSSSGGSGGGGGGGGGGGSGTFGRSAALVTSGQQAPSGTSTVTNVNGIGPLTSGPLTADLAGLPGVTVTWATQIDNAPGPNAKITTAIQQVPDAMTMTAFTNALNRAGQDIASLAYAMVVQKTGVTSTGPATITMTAPQDWVSQNGGTDAIKIVRMADDGTTEILTATFDGYDPNSGYLTFKAASPNGMSSFGLVAVKAYTAPAVTPTSGQMAPTQAPTNAPAKTATTGLPLMTIAGVIAALAIIGVALVLFTRRK